MDRENTLNHIEKELRTLIPDVRIHLLSNNLPASVEFIAISSAFQKMSRVARMDFLTSNLEKILGEKFYKGLFVGSALTDGEFEEFLKRSDIKTSLPHTEFGSKRSAAANAT